jgi:lipopolysaccharide biosynthesis regulator YciM
MIWLIVLIIAIVVLILYVYLRIKQEKITGYTPYLDALVALLENNDDLAMKKFKEAVSLDSNLVDAYIRLGDLYRKKGDISRAIQIHQSLTVRPTLRKQEEKRVYYALMQDFLDSNRPNKANSFLKEIAKIDKKDKRARMLILKIHEDMENYGDCINVYEESGVNLKEEKRHAYYYAALASDKLSKLTEKSVEKEKEIVNLLKKALKISPKSLSALYYLASYYEKKGNLKKAKEYYLKIVTQHPKQAFLIIAKIEKVYFELGSFDDIIPVYEKIFKDDPMNFSVGYALADLYEKKNDLETAEGIYQKLSDIYPESVLPKVYSLKLKASDKDLKERISEIEKTVSMQQFQCSNCGHKVDQFSFMCPKCHAVESFLPYL